MGYQSCVMRGSGQGFSKLNTPACVAGKIRCIEGETWIRLVKSATVTASGSNSAITDPDNDGAIVDGWSYLYAGDVLTFGPEPNNQTTKVDPVRQIDIFSDIAVLLIIDQH